MSGGSLVRGPRECSSALRGDPKVGRCEKTAVTMPHSLHPGLPTLSTVRNTLLPVKPLGLRNAVIITQANLVLGYRDFKLIFVKYQVEQNNLSATIFKKVTKHCGGWWVCVCMSMYTRVYSGGIEPRDLYTLRRHELFILF